jgi:hypothetical protein
MITFTSDAEATPKAKSKGKSGAKSKGKSEVEPEVKPQVNSEVEPDVNPEVKPEVEPEVNPKAKPEVKPEVNPKAKPDVKLEVTPEVKSGELSDTDHKTGIRKGTLVLTDNWYVKIEDLKVGGNVMVHGILVDGKIKMVYEPTVASIVDVRCFNIESCVCIKKNSLTSNTPYTDVYVTECQPIILDGRRSPAKKHGESFRANDTYYQVVLSVPSVLNINGLFVETFSENSKFTKETDAPRLDKKTQARLENDISIRVEKELRTRLEKETVRLEKELTTRLEKELTVRLEKELTARLEKAHAEEHVRSQEKVRVEEEARLMEKARAEEEARLLEKARAEEEALLEERIRTEEQIHQIVIEKMRKIYDLNEQDKRPPKRDERKTDERPPKRDERKTDERLLKRDERKTDERKTDGRPPKRDERPKRKDVPNSFNQNRRMTFFNT